MGVKWKHECGSNMKPNPNGIQTLTPNSYPEILTIQLKRFKESDGRWARLDTKINYPVKLKYFRDQTYSLVAVGRHTGSSMHAGHYFAWVRYGRTWWKCNDSSVTPMPGRPDRPDSPDRPHRLRRPDHPSRPPWLACLIALATSRALPGEPKMTLATRSNMSYTTSIPTIVWLVWPPMTFRGPQRPK